MLLELLQKIEELDKSATEGPWDATTSEATMNDRSLWRIGQTSKPQVSKSVMRTADAEFIALARTFAPAAARALRTILTECESFEVAHDDEDNPFHQGVHWTVMAIRQSITDAMEADDD